jgi:hypothetical protein
LIGVNMHGCTPSYRILSVASGATHAFRRKAIFLCTET